MIAPVSQEVSQDALHLHFVPSAHSVVRSGASFEVPLRTGPRGSACCSIGGRMAPPPQAPRFKQQCDRSQITEEVLF